MPGTAEQKRQERAKRKERGEVRVEVWLDALVVAYLDDAAAKRGEDRAEAIGFAIREAPFR